MRPKVIVTFERLFLLSIAVSAAALIWLSLGAFAVFAATEITVGAVVVAVSVALVLFVSRLRSNAAKWVLTVLTVGGLVSAGYGLSRDMAVGAAPPVESMIGLICLLLQAGAIGLLFTPTARGWLASRGDAAA